MGAAPGQPAVRGWWVDPAGPKAQPPAYTCLPIIATTACLTRPDASIRNPSRSESSTLLYINVEGISPAGAAACIQRPAGVQRRTAEGAILHKATKLLYRSHDQHMAGHDYEYRLEPCHTTRNRGTSVSRRANNAAAGRAGGDGRQDPRYACSTSGNCPLSVTWP